MIEENNMRGNNMNDNYMHDISLDKISKNMYLSPVYISKIYLDTAGLFSWTLMVVLCSWLFEKIFIGLFRLLKR